jgi:hypothetical protein
MQTITTIGLDIAKSVFQVHGVDAEGKVVIRRQLKRRYVLAFFQERPSLGRRAKSMAWPVPGYWFGWQANAQLLEPRPGPRTNAPAATAARMRGHSPSLPAWSTSPWSRHVMHVPRCG